MQSTIIDESMRYAILVDVIHLTPFGMIGDPAHIEQADCQRLRRALLQFRGKLKQLRNQR